MTSDISVGSHDTPFIGKEARAAAAALSVRERQHLIENLIVKYDRFTETVDAMRNHHWPLAEGTFRRGSIRGILGESRAGKSWAIRSYLNSLGPVAGNHRVPRALYVDAAKGHTSVNLADELLEQLALPVRTRGSTTQMLAKIREKIAAMGVELVVIDDAQWLLCEANGKTVSETIGFITRLAEMRVCNIVLSGERRLAPAIRAHTHAYNRGAFPAPTIEAYDWQTLEGRKDFKFLMMSIDERLPFKEYSNLASSRIATHLYAVSKGLIGLVMEYIQDAAIHAMNEDADRIEIEHLAKAARPRRAIGDPYEPFVSAIDHEDPTGEIRHREKAILEETAPKPTLAKRRSKKMLS